MFLAGITLGDFAFGFATFIVLAVIVGLFAIVIHELLK